MDTIRMKQNHIGTYHISDAIKGMIDLYRKVSVLAENEIQVVSCFNGVDLVVDQQHNTIDLVHQAWTSERERERNGCQR